jgi:hypothetical protein
MKHKAPVNFSCTMHTMSLLLFRTGLHVWARCYQAACRLRDTVTEWKCRALARAPLHVTRIQHVDDSGSAKIVYDLESASGFLQYAVGRTPALPAGNDAPLLWAVRCIVRGTRIHTVLLRCSTEDLRGVLERASAFSPRTRIILAFLNGINVTNAVLPLVSSFNSDNALRVKDLAAWLLASDVLSRQHANQLALRDGLLELSLVDSDLDDVEFLGSKQLVVLR